MNDTRRAAAALDVPRTHTFVEGTGWVAPLTEATGSVGTVRVGDVVTGPCATMGTVHTGTVVRIAYVHPGHREIRARIQLADGTTRVVIIERVVIAPALPDGVTATPIGSGATEDIRLDGRLIGDVVSDGPGTRAFATMAGARNFSHHRFATREDAITAVVSYARRGWWTGEI